MCYRSVRLSICEYMCVCMCVAAAAVGYVRAISRISQYITLYLALLLLLLLRRYVGCCGMLLLLLRYREGEISRARARPAAHCSRRFNRYSFCRVSDLRRRLPTQCRPDLRRYLEAAAFASTPLFAPFSCWSSLHSLRDFKLCKDCHL